MREPQIVALGGSGEPGGALNDFLLSLTGERRPRVCYVPTAAGDDPARVVAFLDAFAPRAEATWLPLFHRDSRDLRETLLAQDLIYVSGGNTANMLAVWRVHGVDSILREAWERGTVVCGPSAGAMCWFECGLTDSFGPDLAPLRDGLGFLPGSFCPHYDSEERRRPVYRRLVADGFPAGYAADDAVGVRFRGTEVLEAVTERDGADAYSVSAYSGRAVSGADGSPAEPASLTAASRAMPKHVEHAAGDVREVALGARRL